MTPSPRQAALETILAAVEPLQSVRVRPAEAAGVVHDSRRVVPGSIFVALAGERADGFSFISRAAAAGACAVIVESARFDAALGPAGDAAVAGVADPRRALSRAAAVFYDRPSSSLRVAGVTGTNGKTTVTYLLEAIARAGGVRCARIGTLGAAFEGTTIELANTTPLASDLQALLAGFRDHGAQAVAMEVSSHALDQHRVADIDFAVGAFTNLTRDHLDYHGTMEAYADAKRRLFDRSEVAVINGDDAYGAAWARELRGRRVITYGMRADAAVRAERVAAGAGGTAFTLDGTAFELNLPGEFNVSNALCAIACARELGISDAISARALRDFDRVPGRMESFSGGGVLAIVDYAHTPDALERVLTAARPLGAGDLIAVFGCGGDRDPGKRARMGEIAARLADRSIVTNDNPRHEDPQAIARAILEGFGGANVAVELDRRRAIRAAVESARPGDVIVVAGKGHETYQIAGAVRTEFDDREEVRDALAARAAVPAR